ncbi:hypothetical protein EGT74_16405 [Chitinophaga lutea]|uniref:Uncharacterized protein n=1 Tax=Chitinophaga lutea TaxID=2488634 RepID=A0A3N4PY76_9BACT|nr:hypothetical protein [Chitinophaga lutea]RPE08620.1 hypothetical protein EGT74_16405 [Chitinophaga lutea]
MNNHPEAQPDMLDDEIPVHARFTLLPWWIKVFMWIFLVCGGLVPVVFVLSLSGVDVSLALMGLNVEEPFTWEYFLVLGLFLLKGLVSAALLLEKRQAVLLGMIDCFITIPVCIYTGYRSYLSANNSGVSVNFNIEIVLAILFLWKLYKIRYDWENGLPGNQVAA